MYQDSNGQPKGPVPSNVLIRLLEKGIGVSGDTAVWKEGMTEWKKTSEIEPFKPVVEFINKMWYYIDANGQQKGPVLSRLIIHKLQQGEIDGLTLVYGSNLPNWVKLSDVPELKDAANKVAEEEEKTAELMNSMPTEEQQVYQGDDSTIPADVSFETITSSGKEGKKSFVADDGVKYMWDESEQDWVEDECQESESEGEAEDDDISKEKTVPDSSKEDGKNNETRKRKRKKKKKDWNAASAKLWVYISGLPLDITVEELKEHFSKVGLIAISPLDQLPKIKLYKDEEGNPKGDASICYLAEASVQMAVDVLDGGCIRPLTQPLSVTRAEFTKKDLSSEGTGGKNDWKRPKQALTHAQVKVTQNAMKQALAWNEDDDLGVSKRRALKIVVLENMFHPDEASKDESFFDDLERDIVEECEKCGPIDKITVFSTNPKGVVIVKFHTAFAAQECVRVMDGRFFGGRKLRCMFWDGVTNYSVPTMSTADGTSHTASGATAEVDAEEERLDAFGDWLDKEQEELPEEFRLRTE